MFHLIVVSSTHSRFVEKICQSNLIEHARPINFAEDIYPNFSLMTSDLSDALNSFKLNGDRIRLSSSNSNQRRHWGSGQKHRFSIQSKRSVTIDAESDAEKLRVVILGATRVGRSMMMIINSRF